MHPEVIKTTLNAAPHAAKKEKHGSTPIVATGIVLITLVTIIDVKCFLWYVLSAVRLLKCRSNPALIDLCIVVIATIRSD
jgi:hypothetical protein